jgi:hypothetical protein
MNMGVVAAESIPARVSTNSRDVQQLDNRPNVPGPWVYVETGDPEFDTNQSPEWQNDLYYLAGLPIAFRSGLDGQLDMMGMYDLTLGYVPGDVGWVLPVKWRDGAPPVATFPVELDVGVWQMWVQLIDLTNGEVTLWPMCADACP